MNLIHLDNLSRFKGKNVIVANFYADEGLQKACKILNIEVFGDNANRVPDKRWIHPNIPGSLYPSGLDLYGVEFPFLTVKVPKGYTCYTVEELQVAKVLLEKDGVKEFVLKCAHGFFGKDIHFIKTNEEFNSLLSNIEFKPCEYDLVNYETIPAFLLEEKIELFYEKENVNFSPVVYYIGAKIIKYSRQLVKDKTYVGNRSVLFNDHINKNVLEQVEAFANVVSTFNKGPWGVDLLQDLQGEVYITDPNLGRFNAGMFMSIFLSMYAPYKCFLSRRIDSDDWEKTYAKAVEKNIFFDFSTQKGIMFILPTNTCHSNMITVADTDEEVDELNFIYSSLLN
jgi:hypothetical protein